MDNAIFAKFEADGSQTVYDPSSIAAAMACRQSYKYNVRDKLTRIKTDPRMAMPRSWGTFWHAGIEKYETLIFEGASPEDAIQEGMIVAAREYKAMPLRNEPSDESARNLDTLMRALVWYYLKYKDDKLKTLMLPNGKPALETRFEVPLPGTKWRISGRIDRVVVDDMGYIYPMDHKTTIKTIDEERPDEFFQMYNPNVQFPTYYWGLRSFLGTNVRGVIVNACQTAVRFTRYGRYLIQYTETQLDEYMAEFIKLFEQLDRGDFGRNPSSCDMYGGCQYRPLCSVPPEVRATIIDEQYLVRP